MKPEVRLKETFYVSTLFNYDGKELYPVDMVDEGKTYAEKYAVELREVAPLTLSVQYNTAEGDTLFLYWTQGVLESEGNYTILNGEATLTDRGDSLFYSWNGWRWATITVEKGYLVVRLHKAFIRAICYELQREAHYQTSYKNTRGEE
jgi:hypothetical protein